MNTIRILPLALLLAVSAPALSAPAAETDPAKITTSLKALRGDKAKMQTYCKAVALDQQAFDLAMKWEGAKSAERMAESRKLKDTLPPVRDGNAVVNAYEADFVKKNPGKLFMKDPAILDLKKALGDLDQACQKGGKSR